VVVPREDTSEIRQRILGFVTDVNSGLDFESRIIRVVFSDSLYQRYGLLTANLKLNRKAIEARFDSEVSGRCSMNHSAKPKTSTSDRLRELLAENLPRSSKGVAFGPETSLRQLGISSLGP